jgi:hypothetical protein
MSAPTASNRRLVWLVLLALAIWFLRDVFNPDSAPERKANRPQSANATTARTRALRAPPEDVCTVPSVIPQRGTLVAKALANPFVLPPPPPIKPPKAVKVAPVVAVAPEPPPPPAAPPPPRLPFTYIGQFVDPGRPTTVFLNLGNALINASPGDTLDGGFRLESVGPKELVFVHVQRNVTVRMPIEGERL